LGRVEPGTGRSRGARRSRRARRCRREGRGPRPGPPGHPVPRLRTPSSCSLLLRHLGLRGVPAMDVRNQCSGFLYMLATADKFIRTGGSATRARRRGGDAFDRPRPDDRRPRGRRDLRRRRGRRRARRGTRSDEGILTTHLHSEGSTPRSSWSRCRRRCATRASRPTC
jgi:hypothetical protein